MSDVRTVVASDAALLVVLGDERSDRVLERVHALFDAVQHAAPPWLLDLHPAYASVLVEFDALLVGHDDVDRFVRTLPVATLPRRAPHAHTIPVHYGAGDPCDLDSVAGATNMPRDAVIACHTGALYTVAFLGFMPGFAYLAGLDGRLAVPRLAAPRARVAAGSVAIAAGQAAVYPEAGPGGWHILGVTTIAIGSLALSPGDTVRFAPVEPAP